MSAGSEAAVGWMYPVGRRPRRPAPPVVPAQTPPHGSAPPGSAVDEAWPSELYLEGIRNSRYARFVGDAWRPRLLDPKKLEDKAFHDEIVRDVQEHVELNLALPTSTGLHRNFIERRTRLVDDRIDRLVDQLYGLPREMVAAIKRRLDPPGEVPPAQEIEDKTSDALWMQLEGAARDEAWSAALSELVERQDPGLASYLAAELRARELSPAVRNALVFAAESTQCFDPDTRASITASLFAHAVILRDAGEERPLWAAVRRYASMVPIEEADGLLAFLRDEDAPTTKQAALQGIQNIFTVDVADERAAVDRLRQRVHVLAEDLISPACLEVRGGPALALQAFCAAAALLDPTLPALAGRLVELGRPYLLRRSEEHVRSLDGLWARRPEEARTAEARRILSDSLAHLTPAANTAHTGARGT